MSDETGIIKNGTVTVNPDGSVLIECFEFGDVGLSNASILAAEWAIQQLKDGIKEVR